MYITFKGQFESEEQLLKREDISNAVQIDGIDVKKQSRELKMGVIGFLETFILYVAANLISTKIKSEGVALSQLLITTAITTILIMLALLLHEILHALGFPYRSKKEIWKLSEITFFLYCTEPVSKRRYIFLTLLPSVVLGFLPLGITFFAYNILSTSLVFGLSLFAVVNIYASSVDFDVVNNVLHQVPKNGKVFCDGLGMYWTV